MAKLIYSTLASLDGYTEDKQGSIDWTEPDDEVHGFINDLVRPVGTHLYGRRMYEAMAVWETMGTSSDEPAVTRDFAEVWRAAEKVVYSRTLQTPSSTRTTIERDFDPAAIRKLKQSSPTDILIGGAGLAGQAIASDLVDECHLFLVPILLGGGKRALPNDVRTRLELLAEHRFQSDVVHLHYRLHT